MRCLDLTLPTAAENLALDEALLEQAEMAAGPMEMLRFWEPAQYMVVVGRSSRVDAEVDRDACETLGIPVLRRVSGGAAIVTGPGCLMYSLVLGYEIRPRLRAISAAHRFVLSAIVDALTPLVAGVRFCGTSDLAIGGTGRASGTQHVRQSLTYGAGGTQNVRPSLTYAASVTQHVRQSLTYGAVGTQSRSAGEYKFSGNSMRCRRRHLLYHGTILYNFPLELIARCLKVPPRMPDYRNERDHAAFVTNLPIPADAIRRALVSAWNAEQPLDDWPRELTASLAAGKYGDPRWNQ